MVGLGRAEPETRKARKPELFGPARWPVGPRAGPNSWPDPNYFIFRAMGQRISGKLKINFCEIIFYGKFLTFLYKGAIFSLIFQLFFGAWPEFSGWPEFRPKIRAGPSFSPKNRAGPTARWPAGQAFDQPESPRAGKFPARPNPRKNQRDFFLRYKCEKPNKFHLFCDVAVTNIQ